MTQLHGLNSYNSAQNLTVLGCFSRFMWVIPGKLARSAQPHYNNQTDEEQTLSDQEVQLLKNNKISCLLGINQFSMDDASKVLLRKAGIAFYHFSVRDMRSPSWIQLVKAATIIDIESGRKGGGAVLVYCGYGQGRTGTVVAAWAMLRYLAPRRVNIEPLCTAANLKIHFGVERSDSQVRAIRRAAGLSEQAPPPPPPPMQPSPILLAPASPPRLMSLGSASFRPMHSIRSRRSPLLLPSGLADDDNL